MISLLSRVSTALQGLVPFENMLRVHLISLSALLTKILNSTSPNNILWGTPLIPVFTSTLSHWLQLTECKHPAMSVYTSNPCLSSLGCHIGQCQMVFIPVTLCCDIALQACAHLQCLSFILHNMCISIELGLQRSWSGLEFFCAALQVLSCWPEIPLQTQGTLSGPGNKLVGVG